MHASCRAAAARQPFRLAAAVVEGALGEARASRGSHLPDVTEDNLLRQVSYQGQREDKPPRQVVRAIPHPRQR